MPGILDPLTDFTISLRHLHEVDIPHKTAYGKAADIAI
jgi:hypothetical protein